MKHTPHLAMILPGHWVLGSVELLFEFQRTKPVS